MTFLSDVMNGMGESGLHELVNRENPDAHGNIRRYGPGNLRSHLGTKDSSALNSAIT